MSNFNSIFRAGLFQGQTILVTGGGSGIGRVIAHELASLGAYVIICGRKKEKLALVTAEIEQAGGKVSYRICNIRDEDAVESMMKGVVREHGPLQGLVNNAGGQFPSPAEMISKKGWHAVIETNLTGTFMVSKAAFNHSMNIHGGSIVSIVAEMWRGFPGMVHTGAARAGVVNMTQTLALEWARAGVRLNAVAPGLIDGNGIQQYGSMGQQFIELARQDLPMRRMGSESEVSAAVVFLLSPAGAYINGETIRVDGASSLWKKSWEIPDDIENTAPPFDGFS